MTSGRTRWWSTGLAYFVVALVFAWDLLAPGRTLCHWNTLAYHWPVLLEARSQILSGHWPFWASSFCCGTPLLANINAGVLYPLQLLCWVLPLNVGYHLFLFVHVWLTFVGMHIFLRRGLKLPWISAVVGALIFGGSGYARGMWDTHSFMALPWVPLGFASLLEARRRIRLLIPAAMTAGCWSMMILGGDFQSACLWIPVAVLLVLMLPERRDLLRVLVTGAGMAVLITSAQWLPAVDALRESYRAGGLDYTDAVDCSLNPVRIVEYVLPYAFGTRDAWFGGALAGSGASPWISSIHVGLIAWLGIYLGVRRLRRPVITWSLVVATTALVLSYGRFLPGFRAWASLPFLGGCFRCPEKFMLWTTFSLATLAACGASMLAALFRRHGLVHARHIVLARWSMVMLLCALTASIAVFMLASNIPELAGWMRRIYVNTLLTALLVLVAALRTWPGRQQTVLIGLVLVDMILPWYNEHPTTTLFDPAAPSYVAQSIMKSDSPMGRFMRDRALSANHVPVPGVFPLLTPSQQQSVMFHESMMFDAPRLWGLRSADGFSPTESDAVRVFRTKLAAPEKESDLLPSTANLAEFCRQSAVEWLLTTPDRMGALALAGLDVYPQATWGSARDVVLVRIKGVREVSVLECASGVAPRCTGVWRRRPGVMRVDLVPGSASRIMVSESYANGWRARDEEGRSLSVEPVGGGFIGVRVPAGTRQVRLVFAPPSWKTAVLGSVAGLACLMAALMHAFRPRMPRVVRRPAVAAAAACLVFVALGVSARDQWSPVFDEGFHLARGFALSEMKDSRLSYVQPPLQNLVCGYFADLAWGERIRWPDTESWKNADASLCAVDFASLNADIFEGLVRAARNGSMLFGLLLCVVGVYWASRSGGALAGWIAACGLAMNPTLLAHGNLATADAGVAALVVAGTFYLWRGARGMPWRNLFWAMCCFVFAALANFTGLIWLAVFLFLCVPCLAWQETRPSLLFLMIVGVGMFGLCLLILYGPQLQEVRVEGLSWTGARITAGRYVEGIVLQAGRAMEGHSAFFNGRTLDSLSIWHLPAAVVLKTPTAWVIASLFAAGFVIRRLIRTEVLIPLLPAIFYAVLLVSANRLALGVRHVLPLSSLAVLAVSIAVSRIPRRWARSAVAGVLAASAVCSVALSFPHFLSYFPAWAGGVKGGHRWLVDSNCDWGQDFGEVERTWASLTTANGGAPPNLVYYGFMDPRVMYHLDVGPHSYCGYMEERAIRQGGRAIEEQWKRQRFASFPGTTVASISALELQPAEIDFGKIRQGLQVGRTGPSFFTYRSSP